MQNEYILKYQGKELKMPQWGDMNDFIMIRTQYDLQILPLSMGIGNRAYCGTPLGRNTTHELNTKFNGLFKDCVYGGGDNVVVKMQIIKISNHTYKNGDVVSTWIEGIYAVVRWSDYFNGWALFCYKKEYEGNNDIPLSICNLTPEMIDKIVIKGNILDEYLEGKNELAKMCGFE